MAHWERALVVGASSGLGEALARELAVRGAQVALVARRAEELDRVAADIDREVGGQRAHPFPHDVRDTPGAEALFQEITTCLSGLDVVVYAAGVMPAIGPAEYNPAKDLDILRTNLEGAIAWLDLAADRFGKDRTGTIVGISSVAGDRGRRGNPVYGASKAAINTYLESLRTRLAVKGVTVLTAKPGFVRTAMLEGAKVPPLVPVTDPRDAARQILDAAAAGKRVIYVPKWWRFIMWGIKMVPAPLFERLNV